MIYRPEIDGLRTIAVVPVILFHAGFDVFSGGFVGVDVFFVISGYLITSILIADIERGQFSILKFYERRARRILPALFFVMVCCLPFAWMWMLPTQLKDFAQSVAAVSLFVSNVLFWRETDYFAPASEEKPLLHTWSLAVEEQYYVFFPLLLIFAWRFGRNNVFWGIAFLASISLALSELGWRNSPAANFYLAPTRVWELFAGSMAAFLTLTRTKYIDDMLSLAGLGAIIFSIFYYDKTIPFPSLYAAVPVVGSVLIILYGHDRTLVGRMLSVKPMVVIGLLSYSTYLWHQPLFAFARIRSITEPSEMMMGLLAVVSVLMAAFSWKYVEQPFRAGKNTLVQKRSSVFALSAVGLVVFLGLGVFGHMQQGATWRFKNFTQLEAVLAEGLNRAGRECHHSENEPYSSIPQHCARLVPDSIGKALLLGDSHSMTISTKTSEALNAIGFDAYNVSYAGCLPLVGYRRFDRGLDHLCSDFVQSALDEAKEIGIDTLILTARFPLYYAGHGYDNGEGGVERSKDVVSDIATLSKSSQDSDARKSRLLKNFSDQIDELSRDFKIVLVMPVPENGWNVVDVVAKEMAFNKAVDFELSSSFAQYLERTKPIRDLFEGLAADLENVAVAHIQNGFCTSETGRCVAFSDQGSYYFDDDHLTLRGAEIAAGIIAPVVLELSR